MFIWIGWKELFYRRKPPRQPLMPSQVEPFALILTAGSRANVCSATFACPVSESAALYHRRSESATPKAMNVGRGTEL